MKVVSLADFKNKKSVDVLVGAINKMAETAKIPEVVKDLEAKQTLAAKLALEEAQAKNEANRQRLIKERLQANKGVLKSYRIKN